MPYTYRQILTANFSDREEEIDAIEFPDLDLIVGDDRRDWYSLILSICQYYKVKLDEAEQMYQDDMDQWR